MSFEQYQSHQLTSHLEFLLKRKSSGTLTVKTEVSSWQYQRSYNFVLNCGGIVFGDVKTPNSEELCSALGKKFNPDAINKALLVVQQQVNNTQSHQECVELLVKMNVFSWKDVEAFVLNNVISNLEIFSSYPGKYKWQTASDFDLFTGEDQKGLSWSDIKPKLDLRQQKWTKLMPKISTIDAVPSIQKKQFKNIDDAKIKKHLSKLVNGKNSLLDIADKLGKDHYKVAKTYYEWVKNGWITFEAKATSSTAKNYPIVLSLDDSPIIQIMIKRSLLGICNVMLTDKPAEALEILDSHPVKMLLLDLTLPDVDGLEFCETVRKNPKFKDLPIIMVTARDGLVNRAKGHFAGTTKYITKPFQPNELRDIVSEYIK